jgi:hypothetical protein
MEGHLYHWQNQVFARGVAAVPANQLSVVHRQQIIVCFPMGCCVVVGSVPAQHHQMQTMSFSCLAERSGLLISRSHCNSTLIFEAQGMRGSLCELTHGWCCKDGLGQLRSTLLILFFQEHVVVIVPVLPWTYNGSPYCVWLGQLSAVMRPQWLKMMLFSYTSLGAQQAPSS